MKNKMKPKNIYLVKTVYGERECVEFCGDGWIALSSGKKYDESEFISYSKIKGTLTGEKKENES